MTAARPALGRGLGALIPSAPSEGESGARGTPLQVSLDAIRPNPEQPRAKVELGALEELAASIRTMGVLQPLLVTPAPERGYTLVAGERRWRAARLAGLATVPVVVTSLAGDELLTAALVENLQREDLSPLEEARAYQRLLETTGESQGDIARRVGKSRSAVANALRLLRLPDAVRESLAAAEISEGHARAILGAPDAASQERLWRRVRERGLSVRETERAARGLRVPPPAPRAAPGANPTPADAALEDQLQRALGTQVVVHRGRKGGWLAVRWYDEAQLQEVVARITATPAEAATPPPEGFTI